MAALKKIAPYLLLASIPVLYVATLARTLVLGDPTEYTFVANTLGIAHPPGYAFITVLGKLFQTLVPLGEIPWRMHLLSAVVATAAALFIFGTLRTLATAVTPSSPPLNIGLVAALFGALTSATAVNIWQHAIHANPHIITATFLVANLFLLTNWWAACERARRDPAHPGSKATPAPRWLFLFSLSAGLGVTHHPLTVFAFPAYAIFILWTRPSLWKEWRTLLGMVGFALLGLTVWLYLPIRSSMAPAFGPDTLNTLDGFLDHVLGRGITEALPYYALVEQPLRLTVFWSILRLQYALPVIFLALLGAAWPLVDWLVRRRNGRAPLPAPTKPIILYLLAFASLYAFVISLKAQDIMAYILGPLMIVALLSGVGLLALLGYLAARVPQARTPLLLLAGALFLFGPVLQVVRNVSRISLSDYSEGNDYVTAVFEQFGGTQAGAVILNDWEHMTPLWYTQLVDQRWPDPADVRPEFVSTARTWLDNVFDYLPGGPVYLSGYRREIVDAGFRLRPSGPFYEVVEPGNTAVPPELIPVSGRGDAIEIVAYQLPQEPVRAGAFVPFTLAMRTAGTTDFYVPMLQVGELHLPFTTDSHLTTPNWQPGEVIVERFDFALPHDLPPGGYPVTLGIKNLSTDSDTDLALPLGTLTTTAAERIIPSDNLLANFRQRAGLESATARSRSGRVTAPWAEPITAVPGDIINLTLNWRALDYAEESYTVFVHLIDLANRPIVALDYTPLGGAAPTHLWIPKWLPGQRYIDPYRLQIPPDLPPGHYLIEVGLYEMTSGRRLHMSDVKGNLVGDRMILGGVTVGKGE